MQQIGSTPTQSILNNQNLYISTQKIKSGCTTSSSLIFYHFIIHSKINININNLCPELSPIIISHSVYNKVKELTDNILVLHSKSNKDIQQPYHLLISNERLGLSSICKMHMCLFYLELAELISITYLVNLIEKKSTTILFVNSAFHEQNMGFMNLYQKDDNIYTTNIHDNNIMGSNIASDVAMDVVFMDNLTHLDYHAALKIIYKYQHEGSTLMIKTSDLFYKQSIEFINILKSLYHQVIFIQPSISDVLRGDKYIVCKNKKNNYTVSSFYSDTPWSVHLLNKIEDMNIYFGKKQLESLQQYIESPDNAKFNICKSIQWCKTFKIPYNSLF